MKNLLLLSGLLISGLGHAQLIFRSHFGPLDVPPLFPQNNGVYVLPDEPAANQLQWIIDQLAESSTSIADINAHFSAGWLSQIDAQETQAFIDSVRSSYPDAEITDLVALSAMHANVFVTGSNNNTGVILLEVSYTAGQKITAFGLGFICFWSKIPHLCLEIRNSAPQNAHLGWILNVLKLQYSICAWK